MLPDQFSNGRLNYLACTTVRRNEESKKIIKLGEGSGWWDHIIKQDSLWTGQNGVPPECYLTYGKLKLTSIAWGSYSNFKFFQVGSHKSQCETLVVYLTFMMLNSLVWLQAQLYIFSCMINQFYGVLMVSHSLNSVILQLYEILLSPRVATIVLFKFCVSHS